jgi:hypothetical protein
MTLADECACAVLNWDRMATGMDAGGYCRRQHGPERPGELAGAAAAAVVPAEHKARFTDGSQGW